MKAHALLNFIDFNPAFIGFITGNQQKDLLRQL